MEFNKTHRSGANLSILPTKLDNSFMFNSKVSIKDLLSFELNEVENLYGFDTAANVFRLEHSDAEYLARATGVLNPLGVRFYAKFVEENVTEYGIGYVGIIKVHHQFEVLDIKVPGELTYDPGAMPGDTMWVEYHQAYKLIVYIVLLVKACLFGSTKKLLKRISVVMKPIVSRYYQKELLFRWSYKQVKYACIYKKKPVSYADFLLKLDKNTLGTIQNYLSNLEMLAKGEIQEILPPPEFFKGINEDTEINKYMKFRILDNYDPKHEESLENSESVPTLQEIYDDLIQSKMKYEREIYLSFKNITSLANSDTELKNIRKHNVIFSLEKSFTSQCPIY
jgi:molybdopterin converting factor small subunit